MIFQTTKRQTSLTINVSIAITYNGKPVKSICSAVTILLQVEPKLLLLKQMEPFFQQYCIQKCVKMICHGKLIVKLSLLEIS